VFDPRALLLSPIRSPHISGNGTCPGEIEESRPCLIQARVAHHTSPAPRIKSSLARSYRPVPASAHFCATEAASSREPTSRKVSVVMPTHNRLAQLRKALAAFRTQTVDAAEFEVIVVSDGSTDGTDDFLCQADLPFHLVHASQANAGPAAARNRGARLAAGEILLFVDDDVIAQADLIEQHVRTHQIHGDLVVVVGPMLTPQDYRPGPFVRWEQAMLYKQYDALIRGDYEASYRQFYTGNASLQREFFLAEGGFDERFRRAEDVELAYRLATSGAKFVFNESAIGRHYAERSFSSWISNARHYGRNDVVFDREQGRTDRLDAVRREFTGRHVLIQWLTRASVGRPWLESSLQWAVRGFTAASDRLGCHRMTRFALSGLYNSTYYCGLAEELGGTDAFWELIDGEAMLKAQL
jgi:GT2 family glycosyltransferase